jgi:hypothetical protein
VSQKESERRAAIRRGGDALAVRARSHAPASSPRSFHRAAVSRIFACGLLLAAAGFTPVHAASAESDPTPGSPRRAFIDEYCAGCHNERVRRAGLALTALDVGRIGDDPEVWEKVVHKLRARFMPPIGRERPDEVTYDRMVADVEGELDRAALAHPDPGTTPALHRLNRTEYRNSVRDLLALDVDVSSLLPRDESSHGFDNVSGAGINPSLLERYLAAAQKISRLVVGRPVPSPSAAVFEVPADRTQQEHVEGLPFGTRGGAVIDHVFPRDGVYEIQLQLVRSEGQSVEALNDEYEIELTLDGEQVELFAVSPRPTAGGQQAGYQARRSVEAGPHRVGAAFLANPSSLLETERQPYLAAFNPLRSPRPEPALYTISIVGPLEDAGPGDTPSRERIFVCRPTKTSDEDGCARRILATLAHRAYRRPIGTADLAIPLEFYRQGRADGGFEAGIEMALRAILVSPEFLFRIERTPAGVEPGTVYALDDLALASRLSFFLWSSLPDDELLALAERGALHQPATLETQVRRMLRDPRSRALSTNFADQWLYLRNLESTHPDPRLFPDFDDNLRQAMRRETELFVESIVDGDRPVMELLTANYSFLNERLAKHYGVPNVYGSRFRRVTFPDGSVRGGLLGQASILTVTAYANRTSPVLRGKWILETILGAAPPPPPGNVPALQEPSPGARVLPMRERMAEHRSNPNCAGCHNLMDPIGFSTETFDAVGRHRTRDQSGGTIDDAGSLPDGTSYHGIAGLRDAVLRRPETFATAMVEKLLTYALGRGVEPRDGAAVRSIVRRAREDDYRFSSIVQAIVQSVPFQLRRSA